MEKATKKIKITITDGFVKEYVKTLIPIYKGMLAKDDNAYGKVCNQLEVLHKADLISFAEYRILCNLFLWEIL